MPDTLIVAQNIFFRFYHLKEGLESTKEILSSLHEQLEPAQLILVLVFNITFFVFVATKVRKGEQRVLFDVSAFAG